MSEWIITSCVLIVIVMLLRLVLKGRISLWLQYSLWLVVLARLLIPVNFFSSPMSVMNIVPQTEAAAAPVPESPVPQVFSPELPTPEIPQITPSLTPAESVQNATTPAITEAAPAISETVPAVSAPAPMEATQPEPEYTPTLKDIAFALWLLGMAVTAAIILAANIRFALRLRRSRQKEEADCRLPVYSTKILDTPCLFGIFRPAIYLTADALEDDQKTHVLTHELTHYRHWDHIWSALRGVCLVLHWYNPLVWAGAILSRRDAELACDEGAIRCLGEENRIDYGKTLLHMTCAKKDTKALFLTATTMTGSKKTIKQRISLIAKHPKTAVYAAICLVLVAAIAVGCTFTGAKKAASTPKEATQSTLPTPEELPFDTNELEFWFSSGAGAWSSRLMLNKDGSFTGNYHDTEPAEVGKDYRNGTRYQSSFDGSFEIVKQPNDYCIELQLTHVQTEQPADTISFEDGMRIITANAVGLDGGSRFILYLPNVTIEQIPEDERTWLPLHTHNMKNDEALGFFYLYNVDGETGFYGLIDNYTESVIVTDKPAAEVLTTSYKLEDLRAVMGDRESSNGNMFAEVSTTVISLNMLQQNFPIECFKSRYVVYAVAEGGYYYVLPKMDKESYAVGEQVVLADTQVECAFYIPKVCTLSDYENIEVGKSTSREVLDMDFNIVTYFGDGWGMASYSVLSDGRPVTIEYDQQSYTDFSNADTAIISNIQIGDIGDEFLDVDGAIWWSIISQEDWPKETTTGIQTDTEITLAELFAQDGFSVDTDFLNFVTYYNETYYCFSSHNHVFMIDWNTLVNGYTFLPTEKNGYDDSLDEICITFSDINYEEGSICVNKADQLWVGEENYYEVPGLYQKIHKTLSFHTEKSDRYFKVEPSTAGNTYTVYGFDTSEMVNRTSYYLYLTDDNYVYAWAQYGTGTMARRAKFYDPATGRESPTYYGPSDYYQNMVVAYGKNSEGRMDFCTVTVYDIFSGKALFTVDEYEIPINRTMFNAVDLVYFNVDGSAILVQYYDENYDLHWQTIPLPTEVRLNRTVTIAKTTKQLPQYTSGTQTDKPWDDPENSPSSNIPVPDQQAATEIAEAIINTHFTGYERCSVGFHTAGKVWVIGFSNADLNTGLMIAISWDDAQILGVWETAANATYTDGTTPWETEQNLLSAPVISKQELAGLIGEAIRASWSRQGGMYYPHSCVQKVYYEQSEGYWIISLYPHAQYPVDEYTYIVMDETDGHIIKIWHHIY